jgi:hypothetical protein
MKKSKLLAIAVIMVMALSAANIHAQEANNHLAFGVGGLFSIDKIGVGMGPGLQVSWYNSKLFNNFIGLGAHLGVLMPITKERLSLGISATVGATYTVFDNGTLAIPITAGLHFDFVTALLNIETGDGLVGMYAMNIGLGVVTDFEWHFSQKWYAYGRVALAFNFGAFEFLLMPGIGMGFSF